MEGTIVNVPPKGGRKHPDQNFIKLNTSNILFIAKPIVLFVSII